MSSIHTRIRSYRPILQIPKVPTCHANSMPSRMFLTIIIILLVLPFWHILLGPWLNFFSFFSDMLLSKKLIRPDLAKLVMLSLSLYESDNYYSVQHLAHFYRIPSPYVNKIGTVTPYPPLGCLGLHRLV